MADNIRFNVKFLNVRFTINSGGQQVREEIDIPNNAVRIVGVQVIENPVAGAYVTDIKRYGVGAPNQSTEAFVQTLAAEFMLSTPDYFTVNAGAEEKIYYAQPKRLGFVVFEYGGSLGGFLNPKTVTITQDGNTEEYYLWESAQKNLNETEVHVIQP